MGFRLLNNAVPADEILRVLTLALELPTSYYQLFIAFIEAAQRELLDYSL